MLDQLKELFKEGLQYTHTAGILQQLANLTNIVHAQYMKDGSNSKNTAIDLLCEVLQSHKDVISPDQPVAPVEVVPNASN